MPTESETEVIREDVNRLRTLLKTLQRRDAHGILQAGSMTDEEIRKQCDMRARNMLANLVKAEGTIGRFLREELALLTAALHAKGFKEGTIRVEINGEENEPFDIKRKLLRDGEGKKIPETRHFRYSQGTGEKKHRNPYGNLAKVGIDFTEFLSNDDENDE